MRIAIVTETYPPEINGVAMTVGRLVSGMLARGHHVHVFRPKQHAQDHANTAAHYDESLVVGVPIPKYQGLKFGMPAIFTLLTAWKQQRPDVVHVVTEGPLGMAAVLVAKRLGLPVTSSFHTNFHSYTNHYGIGFLKVAISGYLRQLHNATAATFVPTEVLANELSALGYQNLSLMSRGVDTRLFNSDRRSDSLRAQWGLTPHDLVVLYVGRLAAEKNVELVLQSYEAIRQVQPRAVMVFVGDGPLKAKLQQRYPHAIFTGSQRGEMLAAHYASGDLFLFPSVTETYGNVTAEALASGLCVLAYNRAAAAEIILDGHNGAVVASHDEAAFIEKAVALSQDILAMKDMRSRASASVAHLDWEHVYDAFSKKLHEVETAHRQQLVVKTRLRSSEA